MPLRDPLKGGERKKSKKRYLKKSTDILTLSSYWILQNHSIIELLMIFFLSFSLQGTSVDGEAGPSHDRGLPPGMKTSGKLSGRAAKTRAVARGDNLAPAQVKLFTISV